MGTTKKKIIILLILLNLLLLPEALRSQQKQLMRALISSKYGKGISGYVVGIRVGSEDDTLVVLSGGKTEKILIGDLARVIVLSQNQGGNGFLHGALIGTYISTLLIGKADRQPTAYITETFSQGAGLLGTAFLGVVIGGGVGYMVEFRADRETSFNFTGSEMEKRIARRKFYELMSGESSLPNFHFSVQGGHVYTQASKEFQKATGVDPYYYGYGRDVVSEFNWLRKVQLTYSLQPDVELGGAVQWSSEPTISSWNWNYNYQSPNTSIETLAEQSFNVVGYYGVCKYKPFYSTLPRQTDFSIGGGVGVVKIDYTRKKDVTTFSNNPPYSSTQNSVQYDVNDMALSAIVFGEFNYYIHKSLSLGVAADFVYYPPKKVPADPVFNLPEQTIFGNGCIGFVLGLHL